jgi:hypothetical protein
MAAIFLVVVALALIGLVALIVLGFRWTRPQRPLPADLRRADDAEVTMPDQSTVTDAVESIAVQTFPEQ